MRRRVRFRVTSAVGRSSRCYRSPTCGRSGTRGVPARVGAGQLGHRPRAPPADRERASGRGTAAASGPEPRSVQNTEMASGMRRPGVRSGTRRRTNGNGGLPEIDRHRLRRRPRAFGLRRPDGPTRMAAPSCTPPGRAAASQAVHRETGAGMAGLPTGRRLGMATPAGSGAIIAAPGGYGHVHEC